MITDGRRLPMQVEWPKDDPKAEEPLTEATARELVAAIASLTETLKLIEKTREMSPPMVRQGYPFSTAPMIDFPMVPSQQCRLMQIPASEVRAGDLIVQGATDNSTSAT